MKYFLWVLLYIFCRVLTLENNVAHWMLEENGTIVPRLETPFISESPHDLLQFMNRNYHNDNILKLYNKLTEMRVLLTTHFADLVEDTDIQAFFEQETSCKNAKDVELLDWYTATLDDGRRRGIPKKEYKLDDLYHYGKKKFPLCKLNGGYGPAVTVFDHINGLLERHKLVYKPEIGLPPMIENVLSLEQFGHWTEDMLKQNATSWLHAHLASLFWRVKGNATMAVECSKLAINHAPVKYRDLTLIGLGTVLLRSNRPNDAIVILRVASEVDRKRADTFFYIGNCKALFGDFTSAIKYYDEALGLKPNHELAYLHKQGILCHMALINKLPHIKKSLNSYYEGLNAYRNLELSWLNSQIGLLTETKTISITDETELFQILQRSSDIYKLDMQELNMFGNNISIIRNFFKDVTTNDGWIKNNGVYTYKSIHDFHHKLNSIFQRVPVGEFRTANGLLKRHVNVTQSIIRGVPKSNDGLSIRVVSVNPRLKVSAVEVNSNYNIHINNRPETKKDSSQAKKKAKTTKVDETEKFQVAPLKYQLFMKVARNVHEFDTDPNFPSNELCTVKCPIVNIEALHPVFMPFENKGLSMKGVLTDMIKVPVDVQHDLPWHPPNCGSDKDFSAYKRTKHQQNYEIINTEHLRLKLLEYVGDGNVAMIRSIQDTEIGHRIYAAMKMKVAPQWMLYTLASLYWRVRENKQNALRCLLQAKELVKQKYKDIVLVSLGSVFLEMTNFDEAVEAAEAAFSVHSYEPTTNFLLSQLHMVRRLHSMHIASLKQTIRVDPGFMNGLARELLNCWVCALKKSNALQDVDNETVEEINMVCSSDGVDCHFTNPGGLSGLESDSSHVVRLLQEKVNENSITTDVVDLSVFGHFIKNMPTDRKDRASHYENYQTMMRIVNKALEGCGPLGCSNLKPEDLGLNMEECGLRHHLLSYWVNVVGFRQLLDDYQLNIPSEMTNVTPSHKKIPECQIAGDATQDFFLDRLSRVDDKGWMPSSTLRQQFSLMADFYDYDSMGARLAKYIEMNPLSWSAALVSAWWCGGAGWGACAVRCFAAAFARAPAHRVAHALRAFTAMLHMQFKHQDAKDVAYLTFYISPKTKLEAFLNAVSHSFLGEYEQAIWMYRYALSIDSQHLPSKAALHTTMCLMIFGPDARMTN